MKWLKINFHRIKNASREWLWCENFSMFFKNNDLVEDVMICTTTFLNIIIIPLTFYLSYQKMSKEWFHEAVTLASPFKAVQKLRSWSYKHSEEVELNIIFCTYRFREALFCVLNC